MFYYFPYPWKKGEFNNLIQPNLSRNEEYYENNNTRFGGLLFPFIGGLLVGGLLLPRPNYNMPMPYQPYPPQGMYYLSGAINPYMQGVPQYTTIYE
ncbi:MAG: hypothetical protein PUA56_01755 [Bacillales bacterium]|nr:hypothetical protein [Bacillales bacterium]